MSNNEAWLVLSFAIMVVAMLANLYEKCEELEKRLDRLEAGGQPEEDGMPAHSGSVAPGAFRRRDHGV